MAREGALLPGAYLGVSPIQGGNHRLTRRDRRQGALAFELAPLEEQARRDTLVPATSETLIPGSPGAPDEGCLQPGTGAFGAGPS